jgi:hypothetical protein
VNTSVFSFCIFISWCMVPDVKFVFSGPGRRGSSTSVNSLRIPRVPAQGHGLLSPPSRDQPMMQRWETDFMQHCTCSTQFILCQSTPKWGKLIGMKCELFRSIGIRGAEPWSLYSPTQNPFNAISILVYCRDVSQSFIFCMQAQTFMLTFFIFISPHYFPVTPGQKIPQVSVFCGFVGAKQEKFRHSRSMTCI